MLRTANVQAWGVSGATCCPKQCKPGERSRDRGESRSGIASTGPPSGSPQSCVLQLAGFNLYLQTALLRSPAYVRGQAGTSINLAAMGVPFEALLPYGIMIGLFGVTVSSFGGIEE
jgi:hypothetical protein